MQLKMGGKFHLKLNIGERPIANKYREGKMKRTLKRELKVLEIVKREALETSHDRLIRCGVRVVTESLRRLASVLVSTSSVDRVSISSVRMRSSGR